MFRAILAKKERVLAWGSADGSWATIRNYSCSMFLDDPWLMNIHDTSISSLIWRSQKDSVKSQDVAK